MRYVFICMIVYVYMCILSCQILRMFNSLSLCINEYILQFIQYDEHIDVMSVYFGARRESTSSAPGNCYSEIDLSGDNSGDFAKGDFLDNEMDGTIEVDGHRIESVDAQSSDDDIDHIHDVHIPDCKLSKNGSDDDDDDDDGNDDGNGDGDGDGNDNGIYNNSDNDNGSDNNNDNNGNGNDNDSDDKDEGEYGASLTKKLSSSSLEEIYNKLQIVDRAMGGSSGNSNSSSA